ncbi:hypothetical protein CONCODRAFT_8344 [Conidiobolus coronatus NRRL 28638]|uniref:Zn(2)-C6 fungal-type domain-containing protein n=1 Tax=Conidiobolus coronatus (strain ATCC 28846 / CBS 209.66 / NRRL 28638) TaxID=796925 RepID=A0A137P2T7_CONC2|nr:hypothetical protein CONCODRAFT_8344 [Conidiobolus coronatus NRRL 28638]|eukprot:KXN69278.1 hypothetical protein CONCODRAFT_8344 [Conidiobolus coronatus NRRL 28638]
MAFLNFVKLGFLISNIYFFKGIKARTRAAKDKKFNKHYCIPCKLSKKKCSKQLPICDQCKSISFCCQYPEEEAQLKIRFYQSKSDEVATKKRANSKSDSYPPTKLVKNKETKKRTEPVILNSDKSSTTVSLTIQPATESIYSPNLSTIKYSFVQSSQLLHSVDNLSPVQNIFHTPPNSELDPKSDCSASTNSYDCFNRAEFWDELVQLFITQFHSIHPVFNSNQLDTLSLVPNCQAIFHCIGYYFKKDKTQLITQYMEKIMDVQARRMVFKPTVLNTQLYSLISSYYYLLGNYKRARFYLEIATRFSISLGLHQFSERIVSNRPNDYTLTWKSIQKLNRQQNTFSQSFNNIIFSDERY